MTIKLFTPESAPTNSPPCSLSTLLRTDLF